MDLFASGSVLSAPFSSSMFSPSFLGSPPLPLRLWLGPLGIHRAALPSGRARGQVTPPSESHPVSRNVVVVVVVNFREVR